jgi:hypothetical protein
VVGSTEPSPTRDYQHPRNADEEILLEAGLVSGTGSLLTGPHSYQFYAWKLMLDRFQAKAESQDANSIVLGWPVCVGPSATLREKKEPPIEKRRAVNLPDYRLSDGSCGRSVERKYYYEGTNDGLSIRRLHRLENLFTSGRISYCHCVSTGAVDKTFFISSLRSLLLWTDNLLPSSTRHARSSLNT